MENSAISSVVRKSVGNTQINVKQKLEAENGISKILGVDAKAYVNSVEVLNGEATYDIEVCYSVMYLDENNEVLMLNSNASVQNRMEDNKLNSLMLPIYKVEVVDVSIQSANTSDVTVEATLELTLDVVEKAELEPFTPTSENVLVKKELKKLLLVKDAGKATFSVQEEFDMKQNIEKVLLKDATVCLKNTTSGTGYFTVEGKVNVRCYVEYQENEEKRYKLCEEIIPFKEEIDAEHITKEDYVLAMANIKCNDVMYEITGADGMTNILKVDIPVLLNYIAFTNQDIDMPIDAYSLTHKLNLVTDTFYNFELQTNNYKEHIEGNVEIDENLPRIDKVLFSGAENLNITNFYIENDVLKIEGVITVNVVYQGDDDEMSKNSVQVEVPFVVTLTMDEIKEGLQYFVTGNLADFTIKSKKGKELDLDADVNFVIQSYFASPEMFVKEVVLTEELEQTMYPLQIYMAPKSSTLWDISKHLNVQEDVILKQNPNIVFPLEELQNIVYFKQS